MKMLVTGASGLLGSACVRRFKNEYDVVFPDRIDLRDPVETRLLLFENKPDVVINCAAKVGGVKANKELPVQFIEDNLAIQGNIIRSCHESKVKKLVMIGTSCLYPENANIPVSEESLMCGKFAPDVAAYATAKLAGLELCRAYWRQYGDRFMTVCPSNLYGLNDNYGPSAHVIPAIIDRAYDAHNNKKPLVVWGDGSAVREFLYADDCANAISYVIDKWNSPDPINIGTGEGTSLRDLVDLIVAVANLKVDIQWDSTKPVGIHKKTFSINKIKSLGWAPKMPICEGLLKTYIDYIETQVRRK
jgi:GDP-L-fucose synthase